MISHLSRFIGRRYAGAKRRNQLVSFLTGISIVGLVLGVSLLIAVLSIMNGFERDLREKILGLVPQAAVLHHHSIHDWRSVSTALTHHPEVEASAPFIKLNGLISFANKTETTLIYGISPEHEMGVSLIEEYIPAAKLMELSASANHVVIGKKLAEKIRAEEGDTLLLVAPGSYAGEAPKVVYAKLICILQSNTELDSQLVLTSIALAQELAGIDGVTGVRLKLSDLFNAPKVVRELLQTLPPGYYATHWIHTHGNLYQAIQMSKQMVGLLVSLIIAIAAFNIVSTMVMIVIEKESDIAILRTMGASSSDIVKIFIVLGSIIGVAGVGAGVVLGVLLATFAQHIVATIEMLFGVAFLESDVYPLTYLPSEVLLGDIIGVAFIALLLCFVATLYPAYRASRVKPAVALRYE